MLFPATGAGTIWSKFPHDMGTINELFNELPKRVRLFRSILDKEPISPPIYLLTFGELVFLTGFFLSEFLAFHHSGIPCQKALRF